MENPISNESIGKRVAALRKKTTFDTGSTS